MTRIVSNPFICGGKPCFEGSRLPAEVVLANYHAGESKEDIFENYPSSHPDGIEVALEWERLGKPYVLANLEETGFAMRRIDAGEKSVRNPFETLDWVDEKEQNPRLRYILLIDNEGPPRRRLLLYSRHGDNWRFDEIEGRDATIRLTMNDFEHDLDINRFYQPDFYDNLDHISGLAYLTLRHGDHLLDCNAWVEQQKQIEAICTILLIDHAYLPLPRMRVGIWSRCEAVWSYSEVQGKDSEVCLPAVDLRFPISRLYPTLSI